MPTTASSMQTDLPERREAEGLSQEALADAVGVTRQTINSIERGRYDPSLELAAHFECTIEDIFRPDETEN